MYPLDRRKIAVHVYRQTSSLRKTATLLMTSHSSIWRWLHTSERLPYSRCSPKATLVTAAILAAVNADPFATPTTMKHMLSDTFGISVSSELVRTVIRRNGLTRKKARFFGKPVDLEAKVAEFETQRGTYMRENRSFVSVDETSFGRHGAPVFGYAPSGSPLRVARNRPRQTTVSVVAAVASDGSLCRQTRTGSFNAQSFEEFLSCLGATPGTVFLLDNVAFHHSRRVKDLASQRGWILLYVPPYSPWYNPIEGVFSVVKRAFYKSGDVDAAFLHATAHNAIAFYQHAMQYTSCPGNDLIVPRSSDLGFQNAKSC